MRGEAEALEFGVGETVYDPQGRAWNVGAVLCLEGERYYAFDAVGQSLVSLLPASATSHLSRRTGEET